MDIYNKPPNSIRYVPFKQLRHCLTYIPFSLARICIIASVENENMKKKTLQRTEIKNSRTKIP